VHQVQARTDGTPRARVGELPDFLWDRGEELTAPTALSRDRANPLGVPGEVGVWVFVFGDMTIFGLAFSVFLWENRADRSLFADSSAGLVQPIGVLNTLVLLLSSYLVVRAIRAHRREHSRAVKALLGGAMCCAAVFAVLKAVEYTVGIRAGHTPTSNEFFTFYFVLTGVHLAHVLIGAVLLSVWLGRAGRNPRWTEGRGFAEGAATYWHMVDLLWVVIFTLLYLVCVA